MARSAAGPTAGADSNSSPPETSRRSALKVFTANLSSGTGRIVAAQRHEPQLSTTSSTSKKYAQPRTRPVDFREERRQAPSPALSECRRVGRRGGLARVCRGGFVDAGKRARSPRSVTETSRNISPGNRAVNMVDSWGQDSQAGVDEFADDCDVYTERGGQYA